MPRRTIRKSGSRPVSQRFWPAARSPRDRTRPIQAIPATRRARAATSPRDRLLRREQHTHAAAFEQRWALHLADIAHLRRELVEKGAPNLGVLVLPTAEDERGLHLMPLLQELLRRL